MSVALIKAILLLLPQLTQLIKATAEKIESGVDTGTIRRALKTLSDAYKLKDPVERAKRINEVWNNRD